MNTWLVVGCVAGVFALVCGAFLFGEKRAMADPDDAEWDRLRILDQVQARTSGEVRDPQPRISPGGPVHAAANRGPASGSGPGHPTPNAEAPSTAPVQERGTRGPRQEKST